jgi:hypothetical protein
MVITISDGQGNITAKQAEVTKLIAIRDLRKRQLERAELAIVAAIPNLLKERDA